MHNARPNEEYTMNIQYNMHDQTRSIVRTGLLLLFVFVFVLLPVSRAPPVDMIVQRGGQPRCTIISAWSALETLAVTAVALHGVKRRR